MFETIFSFLTGNVTEIFTVIFALHGAALVVVNMTPTPVDNAVLTKVYRVVEIAAGLVGEKVKELRDDEVDKLTEKASKGE